MTRAATLGGVWEPVTTGRSGAAVSRRPGVYRKQSADPRIDLVGEGERLTWLRRHGIPAPEVLDCRPGLLVTAEVPGRSAAEPWPADLRPRVVDALAGLARALHALPAADCPFNRTLAVTIPAALAADPGPGEREVLAARPGPEDTVVCHGDLCVPNVLLDPDTCRVTGVVDAGRLGVADRWADLAVATRSLTSPMNPQYGPWAAARFLDRYGVEPDPVRTRFYRLLDRL
ncbi:aminoglycoside 3'-phosphotransferase [Spirilliplanes yamanashiensis]|uniref:aminoglycoside 3'-phosphotransferase n=1 Tax=Spirilliplanes yamanashiensis TaxID=42233 RepID=UPI00351FA506